MRRHRSDPDRPSKDALDVLHALHLELGAERTTLTLLAEVDRTCRATQAFTFEADATSAHEAPCGCAAHWSWPTPGFDPRHPGRLANRLVVTDAARAALYGRRLLVGVVEAALGVRRDRGNARVDGLLGQLARALGDEPPSHDGSTSFVLGPRGIELYEPSTLTWATPERVARLLAEEPPTTPTVRMLGRHRVAMTPLASRAGPRTLCVVSPCKRLELAPDAVLSPRQREIALLAAEGGTIDELATQTGCSRETVKSHLKAIYQALGVTSRLELRKALS